MATSATPAATIFNPQLQFHIRGGSPLLAWWDPETHPVKPKTAWLWLNAGACCVPWWIAAKSGWTQPSLLLPAPPAV